MIDRGEWALACREPSVSLGNTSCVKRFRSIRVDKPEARANFHAAMEFAFKRPQGLITPPSVL